MPCCASACFRLRVWSCGVPVPERSVSRACKCLLSPSSDQINALFIFIQEVVTVRSLVTQPLSRVWHGWKQTTKQINTNLLHFATLKSLTWPKHTIVQKERWFYFLTVCVFGFCFRTLAVNPFQTFLSLTCVALCVLCVNECINPWSASNSFENIISFARASVCVYERARARMVWKVLTSTRQFGGWTAYPGTPMMTTVHSHLWSWQTQGFNDIYFAVTWKTVHEVLLVTHIRSCILVYFFGIVASWWWARQLRFIVLKLSRLTVTVCSLEDKREGAGQTDQVVTSAVGRAAG